MRIEVRADDSVHISGYVNTVGRESKPVITPHGKVNEVIDEGVFQRAVDKAKALPMTIDHEKRAVATTENGSLKLWEDNIGLRAEAVTSDPNTVEDARNGKIKGWSFGMKNVKDTLEERADKLPLRRIRDIELDHVTLVVKKEPIYSATSVELRAEEESRIELRSTESGTELFIDKKKEDYTDLENRLKKIKGA